MKPKRQGIVFLKGRKVVLRPLNKKTDLEACCRWVNDPTVRQYISTTFPTSIHQEEKWFDDLPNRKDEIVFGIETIGGKIIGVISLVHIKWHDRTATTGAMIGDKRYWGKGYGTDAKMILLDYAFNQLNLRKICSAVFSFNKRSLRYNLRCGYKIEGRLKKQMFKNGKYRDNILLAVLKKDWLPIWHKYQKTGNVK